MAKMMSCLGDKDTQGEREVYKLFDNTLPNVYRIWLNKRVHPCKEVDFVIFEPSIGVWLVEVKDWSIDYIVAAGPDVIKTIDDLLPDNPHKQVEARWKEYMGALKKQPQLIDEKRKDLKFPVCKYVIYTNMSKDDIKQKGIEGVLVLGNSWTSDLVKNEHIDTNILENELLSRMKEGPAYFRPRLNEIDIDAVERFFGKTIVCDLVTKQEIGELDKYQSGLIELPIENQYVIKGPAGSGKSLVLVGRAIRIAKERPDWDIGIFCFNAFMANYLKVIISLDTSFYEIGDRIRVHYFDGAMRSDRSIKFNAILVDEGQDANDEHLRFCFDSLKTHDSSFTIFFDERQKIYGLSDKTISDQLNQIGFKISQEKRLVKQQRSALVVLALAVYEKINNQQKQESEILQEVLENIAPKIFDDGILGRLENTIKSTWASLKSTVKNFLGTNVQDDRNKLSLKMILDDSFSILKSSNYYEDSAKTILTAVKDSQDTKYSDFAILIPYVKMVEQLSNELIKNNIPHEFINKNGFFWNECEKSPSDNRMTFDFTNNCVRILTVQQSKGFDCKYTILLNLEYLDSDHAAGITENGKTKAQLVYVALTRAKAHCSIFYKDKTNIIESLIKFKELMPSEIPKQ